MERARPLLWSSPEELSGWWLITFLTVHTYMLLAYTKKTYRLEIWIPLLIALNFLLVLAAAGFACFIGCP